MEWAYWKLMKSQEEGPGPKVCAWPLLSETDELKAQWEWLTATALATGVKPVIATRYNDRSGS